MKERNGQVCSSLSFGDGHFTHRIPDASRSYGSWVLLPLPFASAIDFVIEDHIPKHIFR
jgi:hypothetical protein